MRGLGPNATAPPLFQTASINIDDMNTRAILIAEGGAEFEISERGIFPVKMVKGRRLSSFGDIGNVLSGAGKVIKDTLEDGTEALGDIGKKDCPTKRRCDCLDPRCQRTTNCRTEKVKC